jgi:hypothetical protein
MSDSGKVVAVTFALFMTEAILHYNLGKKDVQKQETSKGFLPPTKALLKLGGVVMLFSVLNGIIIKEIK